MLNNLNKMKRYIDTRGRTVTETSVIAQVCSLLNNRGFSVWRNNNAGTFNTRIAVEAIDKMFDLVKFGQLTSVQFHNAVESCLRMSHRATPLQKKGAWDIVGYAPDGRFVAIELKLNAKDQLSEEQRAFGEDVRKCGGIVWVIRDFPVFSKWFIEQNANRGAVSCSAKVPGEAPSFYGGGLFS